MSHPELADRFVEDPERTRWHDQSLWFVRAKRDRAAQELPEWEQLRELGARIKAHTRANLPRYLEQFERAAQARGAVVHWAIDAESHNRTVWQLLQDRGVRRVVKSKSMLTEECGLNPFLEERGVEVVDTDLGERIVQLRHEPPSHIVLPAIHLRKEEVGELFHRELGTEEGLSDPVRLTQAAREHLRAKFLAAEAGITGVNFAIAETGGVVVCTNEGNADLGTALPPLHIACMGIEKLIPRAADLGVFTRLLARSATGQPITAYTSHMHGPRPGGELHIVMVDNGRSDLLARESYREALACIRCGACLNTCPVYRRSGGHSYEAVDTRPDRRDPGAGARSSRESHAALRLHSLWFVQRRLSGEDRPRSAVVALARRAGRAGGGGAAPTRCGQTCGAPVGQRASVRVGRAPGALGSAPLSAPRGEGGGGMDLLARPTGGAVAEFSRTDRGIGR